VVVIGDAPAHLRDEGAIDDLIASFVRGGSSFVHAIMTSTDLFGEVAGDTRRSFETIARSGRGLCVASEREEHILEQVLSLAIGAEFRDSVAEVFRIVDQRGSRASARQRDAVRRADAAQITAELSADHVDPEFVELLWTSASPAVAGVLIDALARPGLPTTARQAAAYALQKMLGLTALPIDPLDPRPIAERTGRELRATAAARLR